MKLAALLLLACGRCGGVTADDSPPAPAGGSVEVCLSSDVDQPDAPPDCASHHRSWTFAGQVVEDFAADEGAFTIGHCGHGARTVKILDGDGATWWFGVTALDAEGNDITPATPLAPGTPVEGEVSVGWGGVPEQSAGWLRDAGGVVLAADTRVWWDGLETAPGVLSVDLEQDGARRYAVDDCQLHAGKLHFRGDDELTLVPGASGTVQVLGAALPVRALEAWLSPDPDDPSCGWWEDRAAWVGGR